MFFFKRIRFCAVVFIRFLDLDTFFFGTANHNASENSWLQADEFDGSTVAPGISNASNWYCGCLVKGAVMCKNWERNKAENRLTTCSIVSNNLQLDESYGFNLSGIISFFLCVNEYHELAKIDFCQWISNPRVPPPQQQLRNQIQWQRDSSRNIVAIVRSRGGPDEGRRKKSDDGTEQD